MIIKGGVIRGKTTNRNPVLNWVLIPIGCEVCVVEGVAVYETQKQAIRTRDLAVFGFLLA